MERPAPSRIEKTTMHDRAIEPERTLANELSIGIAVAVIGTVAWLYEQSGKVSRPYSRSPAVCTGGGAGTRIGNETPA